MKGKSILLIGLVAAAALVFASCSFTPDTTYAEASDSTNDNFLTPENAGSIASGTLAITGTINSGSDVDYYKVDVGSKTTLNYEVLYNGKSRKNLLGIDLTFPFAFVTYDASGNVLTNYLLAAGGDSQALDAGTSYIVFEFYANSSFASGTYELDLK